MPQNLRERASSGRKWAEKHARVGFGPTVGPATYASVLLASRNGPRSTLAWVLGLLKAKKEKNKPQKPTRAWFERP